MFNANVQGLIGVAVTRSTSAVAVASGNPTAFFHQRPNPAFKRTHTGGADLWVFRAVRSPVRAA